MIRTVSLRAGMLLCTLCLTLFSTPVALSRTITVTPSGGDYTRIQAALDAATPGDTILVANGTYNEKISFPRSGDAAAGYITLQADPGAVLSGLNISGRDVVLIENRSYIKIIGFEIRDNRTQLNGEGSGIRVLGSGDHIEIRNNRIHEMRGAGLRGNYSAMGITVYGTSSAASISNLIIDGNEIYDCDPAESEALTLNGNVDGFQVTGNYVHDVNNIGIDFIGGEDGFPAQVARNGVCRGNRVVRSRSNYGGGYGAGIYVDGGKDIVIELNTVTESDLGIEIGAENLGTVTSGVIVRNNLVYLNDKAGLVFGGYEVTAGRVQNCQFLNNVCYKNDTKNDGNGQLWIQYASGNTIRNNIFWAAANGVQLASETGNTNNSLDYNLWYADSVNTMEFSWNGQSYTGLPAYRSGTSQDANSLAVNPLFVGAATANFHLQAASPAIDKGDPAYLPAAEVKDIDGNPRLSGSRVDIGAHEFQSGTTTTTTLSTTTTTTTTSTSTSTTSTTTTTAASTTVTTSTTSTSILVTTTTSTTTPPTTLHLRVFPKIQYRADLLPVTPNAGIALANLSNATAQLRMSAYADNGTLIGQTQSALEPGNQLAMMVPEVLPAIVPAATWLLVESSTPNLQGFFLLFDDLVTVMDGSTVSGTTLRDFILPVAEDAEITLVNPAAQATDYQLSYVTSDGVPSRTLLGMIPPKGRVAFQSNLLRPAGSQGGYLRGTTGGVIALEVFGNPLWIGALGPQASASGAPAGGLTLFAPQFVSGGGYSTAVDLVNLENIAVPIIARFFDSNGQTLGSAANLSLPASGSLRIEGPSIFGLSPGPALLEGFLKLESAGGRFAGSVLFTDEQKIRFGCALPLMETAGSLLHFSQVAQNEAYYTGLAVVNPNSQPTDVTVTVYNSRGVFLAAGTRQIPAGGRLSRVLPEIVGTFPAVSEGYFQVQSRLPVLGFALFGTHDGETLAAIPTQAPTGN